MTDHPRPIPGALLDLLRQPWMPETEHQLWDVAWDRNDGDRQVHPAYYLLRPGADGSTAPVSRKQAEALVACGLLAGLAYKDDPVLSVNEHAAHAIQDFAQETYAAWEKLQERFARARAAAARSPRLHSRPLLGASAGGASMEADEPYKWPHGIEPPILFANGHWAVTRYGLECLTSTYQIEVARLTEAGPGDRSRMYDWPVHMAEKEWVDAPAFIEAFEQALRIHAKGHPKPERWQTTLREAEKIARRR